MRVAHAQKSPAQTHHDSTHQRLFKLQKQRVIHVMRGEKCGQDWATTGASIGRNHKRRIHEFKKIIAPQRFFKIQFLRGSRAPLSKRLRLSLSARPFSTN
jgi:hypothetical protein